MGQRGSLGRRQLLQLYVVLWGWPYLLNNFRRVCAIECLVQVFITPSVRRAVEDLASVSLWLYLCKASPPSTS